MTAESAIGIGQEAMFIAVSALQQRIVTPEALERAVAARPRRPRAAMVAGIVEEFRSGVTTMTRSGLTSANIFS